MKRRLICLILILLMTLAGCAKPAPAPAPEEPEPEPAPVAPSAPEEPEPESYDPATRTWKGNGQKITVKEISKDGYIGYAMEIADPSWVHLTLCADFGTHGQKIPYIAKEHNAVAATNAGGFADGGWGNGGRAIGLVISEGRWVQGPANGRSCCLAGFTRDHKLVGGTFTTEEIKKMDLRDACEFDPVLVKNGAAADLSEYGTNYHPRTVIAQRKDGTVLFVVIDGRSSQSAGVTIRQMQKIMLELDVETAINMDGGSSSVLYLRDEGVLNNPSGADSDGMRFLPNAWLVTEPEQG